MTVYRARETSMEYISRTYGVPAKRGARIEYTGNGESRLGKIVGAEGGYLRIKLDGAKYAMPFHPTWEIRYLGCHP